MKVALVHYWLKRMRGGERVLEALCRLYPEADIFTHVVDPERISRTLQRHRIQTSFIARLPLARRCHAAYLPLMPLALEQLDLRGYELIISSEAGPAKGILCDPDALHVCYCHSPMRYIWDLYPQYYRAAPPWCRWPFALLAHYLRIWDVGAAHRVDYFACNSRHVAQRIRRYYGREAEVIAPPILTAGYPARPPRADAPYLFVGYHAPNKGLEVALEAFRRSGRPLVVVSEGPGLERLRRRAPANIRFLGYQPLTELQALYTDCRALVFPGVDDFGMVAAEAMAAGRPVIAYRKGGILDILEPGVNGLFFATAEAGALAAAIDEFESDAGRFDAERIRASVARFDRSHFEAAMQALVERGLAARRGSIA